MKHHLALHAQPLTAEGAPLDTALELDAAQLLLIGAADAGPSQSEAPSSGTEGLVAAVTPPPPPGPCSRW